MLPLFHKTFFVKFFVIRYIFLFSRQDPNLWVQALSFFSSRRECKGHISEVLRHIDEDQLMPPLMVIQTLADSQFATLSDIKV